MLLERARDAAAGMRRALLQSPRCNSRCCATSGRARRGRLELAHGAVETPVFMPVGTYGTVKAMAPNELERARRADRPRQHVPPLAAARARGHRRARRPAPVHGLGAADPHRLRRLPGVEPRAAAQGRARKASRSRRRSTATGCCSRPRSRCRSSARSTPTSRWCSTSARRTRRPATRRRTSMELSLRWARRSRDEFDRARQSERAVRHRAGRHVRRPARRVARRARRRSASTATRSAACRSASRRTRCCAVLEHTRAAAAGRPAALPDGRGHARGPRRRRRGGHRHVRLRAADAQRAQRLAVHALRRRQDPQRRAPRPTRGRSTRPAAATPAAISRAPTCTTCSGSTRSSARASTRSTTSTTTCS